MVFTSSTEAKYEPYCVFKDKNGGSFKLQLRYISFLQTFVKQITYLHTVLSATELPPEVFCDTC